VTARAIKLTPGQIAQRLKAQKKAAGIKRQEKIAQAARTAYLPRKKDRGKIVMIGTRGQKDPQAKGRKGFLVYVSKTGRVRLVKGGKPGEPFRARKFRELTAGAKNLRKKAQSFETSKLELTAQQKPIRKGGGNVTAGGAYDFSDTIVTKIAIDVKTALESQASQRSMLITTNALVKKPDGETTVISFQVQIDKQDHQAIALGGIKNFVRRKFYTFMARQLEFQGLVTKGSANHVRRRPENRGKVRSEWIQADGQRWRGNESGVAEIKTLEYKIEQAT
jgi:hypothetical protein